MPGNILDKYGIRECGRLSARIGAKPRANIVKYTAGINFVQYFMIKIRVHMKWPYPSRQFMKKSGAAAVVDHMVVASNQHQRGNAQLGGMRRAKINRIQHAAKEAGTDFCMHKGIVIVGGNYSGIMR